MVIGVIAFFCATFSVLGWIGWRYFVVPPGGRIVPPEAGPAAPNAGASPVAVRRRADDGLGAQIMASNVHRSLLLALAFVVFSAAAVLALSGRISLDPLSAPALDRQQHIQAALRPEALVPPPPLPPSTFVGTGRPDLESADRNWDRLDPAFASVALKIFARLEARGYPFTLLEGYRSPERQDALADEGAHVTNARAFQSKHQYGLALDAAPLRNARLVISERDPWAMEAYIAFGEEAERAGLLWGGRWRLKDYGHIEASGPVSRIAHRN